LERRTELIVRLGGKCSVCPEVDQVVLEIHHRNGGGGAERKRLGWKYLKYLLRLSVSQLRKDYEVLCANCHIRKTRSNTKEKN
jgi:5-methylcytosine-specific restriction endonuclease McrA